MTKPKHEKPKVIAAEIAALEASDVPRQRFKATDVKMSEILAKAKTCLVCGNAKADVCATCGN